MARAIKKKISKPSQLPPKKRKPEEDHEEQQDEEEDELVVSPQSSQNKVLPPKAKMAKMAKKKIELPKKLLV